jgi:hypothetical protein
MMSTIDQLPTLLKIVKQFSWESDVWLFPYYVKVYGESDHALKD